MYKKLLMVLLVTIAVWKCAPTSSVSSGGGASETVATVAPYEKGVRISVRSDSVFVVAAKVYDSRFSRFDTGRFRDSVLLSDSRPEWLLPVLPESILHVFVIDSVNGIAAFFRHDNSVGSFGMEEKKLTPTGSVSGEVTILSNDGNSRPATEYWVIIPGSPFEAPTGSDGSYRLSGVPEGSYSIEARNNVRMKNTYEKMINIEITGDSIYQQNIDLTE